MSIRSKIEAFRSQSLWHFTDSRNLPSIRSAGGILSLSLVKERAVGTVHHGGNHLSHELDEALGLDKYVHACFTNDHPLEAVARRDGRIQNTRWLKINLNVLDIPGVRFTSVVANRAGAQLLTEDDAIGAIDFEGIFNFMDFQIPGNRERKNSAKKAEILIPHFVPFSSLSEF